MSNRKKITEDSAEFFNKEVDKIIYKVTTTKSTKQRIKYIKQMIALKNRLSLEVKMLEDLDNF
jgi:hypothetical protein